MTTVELVYSARGKNNNNNTTSRGGSVPPLPNPQQAPSLALGAQSLLACSGASMAEALTANNNLPPQRQESLGGSATGAGGGNDSPPPPQLGSVPTTPIPLPTGNGVDESLEASAGASMLRTEKLPPPREESLGGSDLSETK